MTNSETFRVENRQALEQKFAQHDGQIKLLQHQVEEKNKMFDSLHDDFNKIQGVLGKIQVDLGKIQMQIKITWSLLIMVIGGLVSVAFSLWK